MIQLDSNPITEMEGGAIFDRTRRYRYRLWRRWNDALPSITFIMLNPSKADATFNDQTIATCIRTAKRFGFGSLDVVNLFAYRTFDPKELKRARNPIGKLNDEHIIASVKEAKTILLAWGNHGGWNARHEEVLELLLDYSGSTFCLGLTKQGQPRHPLYLPSSTQMIALPSNLRQTVLRS